MARHPRNEQPRDTRTLRVNHIPTPSRDYATQVNVKCHICDQNHATNTCEILLKDFETRVLLATAKIDILDRTGRPIPCRVLLDSCSQANFITINFAKRLQLPAQNINLPITVMNITTSYINQRITARIQSRTSGFTQVFNFLIADAITDLAPSQQFAKDNLQIPVHIKLADPSFHVPSRIDGLLEAEIFWKLLCIGQIQASLILQKTLLGWVITGERTVHTNAPLQCYVTTNAIQEQLTKFWEIEEGLQIQLLSKEEQSCETHYTQSGRLVTRQRQNSRVR